MARCPKAWLRDEAAEEVALFDDVMRLKRFNAWPVSGGVLAQPPVFVDAVDVVDAEILALEARAEKRRNEDG